MKCVLHLLVFAVAVGSVSMLAFAEAVVLTLKQAKAACDLMNREAVVESLSLMPIYKQELVNATAYTDSCQGISSASSNATTGFYGGILCVVGQIICVAAWAKYQQMSASKPQRIIDSERHGATSESDEARLIELPHMPKSAPFHRDSWANSGAGRGKGAGRGRGRGRGGGGERPSFVSSFSTGAGGAPPRTMMTAAAPREKAPRKY